MKSLSDEYLRDRYTEYAGLTWKVFINKQMICDGFKTRQQAHDFINTEIKPLMEKEESIKKIETMNEYNTICCTVDDYAGKQFIKIGLGVPNKKLPDFDGI